MTSLYGADDAAEATGLWWAGQVFGPATDRDALGLTDTADILLGPVMPALGDRGRFADAVAVGVRAELAVAHAAVLQTDYGPVGPLWLRILHGLDIDGLAWPWKKLTCTFPGRLEVGRGEVVWRAGQ